VIERSFKKIHNKIALLSQHTHKSNKKIIRELSELISSHFMFHSLSSRHHRRRRRRVSNEWDARPIYDEAGRKMQY
jgi:TnpA family transposase